MNGRHRIVRSVACDRNRPRRCSWLLEILCPAVGSRCSRESARADGVCDGRRGDERRARPTTTAIGTVVALRSITLRNELAGTVRETALEPGQIVEPGTVLVALDVSVEKADLQALKRLRRTWPTVLERACRA